MTNDDDWVADVKRWCQGLRREGAAAAPDDELGDALGYEAAHPALQARHWPDALMPPPALRDMPPQPPQPAV